MDTSNVTATSSAGSDSEDVLKVLGRVADAFDNPGSLDKTDKEVLFVVNVVKSRHPLTSLSSDESVCQDGTCGSYDSSLESSDDEDVEVVELGDVSKWEHAGSYPYRSRHPSRRSISERVFRQDDGMYDVTRMLLTSSPLDRLDRLARMELKKTGWFERTDKWSVVELGLQVPPPVTPPKTPVETAGDERRERTSSPDGEKHFPQRPGCDHQQQGDPIKYSTPRSIQSPDLADFSTLLYVDTSTLSPRNAMTPIRTSRSSRASRLSPQQTRGRLGEAVRNFVKRMLPPTPVGGSRTRLSMIKGDSPSGRTWTEMTPQSDMSGESRWTFASAGSWIDPPGTSRWSGFWH